MAFVLLSTGSIRNSDGAAFSLFCFCRGREEAPTGSDAGMGMGVSHSTAGLGGERAAPVWKTGGHFPGKRAGTEAVFAEIHQTGMYISTLKENKE
ncbi:MAG: hypothetical protein ACI4P4_05085 [Faecousia sp.]